MCRLQDFCSNCNNDIDLYDIHLLQLKIRKFINGCQENNLQGQMYVVEGKESLIYEFSITLHRLKQSPSTWCQEDIRLFYLTRFEGTPCKF